MYGWLPGHAGSRATRGLLAGLYDGLRWLPGDRKVSSAMTAIAQRELGYRDEAGREHGLEVRVHPPRPDGECWACAYELCGAVEFSGSAYGEDSLQALVLALQAVQAHLNTPSLRGRVFWLGEPVSDLLALPSA